MLSRQLLGGISEWEILQEGISPRVCTNWRPERCHGPWKEAKPGGRCCTRRAVAPFVRGWPALQLVLVPRGISRSLNLPEEGSDWVEQEICPGTKVPARSLMFSFSFCFRGQRGLAPLKQMENEDGVGPALPTTKRDQPEEKAQLGRKSKGESGNGL